MKKWLLAIALPLLLIPFTGGSQTTPERACRIENGRLIFTLDTRWSQQQREKVITLFDLDTEVVRAALNGKSLPVVQGETWSVKRLDENLIELSKPLIRPTENPPAQEDVLLLDDRWIEAAGITERESMPCGINRFTRFDVFSYTNGIARFFLPGKPEAREVILSGSFNGWSTTLASMTRTEEGWAIDVRLRPGKYTYKYIIDGKWTPDPFNRQKENDGAGGNNSVLFCYNYTFQLPGFSSAKNVIVSGSFNNWRTHDFPMQHINGKWVRGMYLREGTHAYKFIVDGDWVLDPANPVIHEDNDGNLNNYVSIGEPSYFRLTGYPFATRVFLTGNFNAWQTHELPMTRIQGGWELAYVLRPGNYEYKFIVDGTPVTDPSNPYTTGTGEDESSFVAIKPNCQFRLKGESDAAKVIVTGSFNNWNFLEYRMILRDGIWTFPMYLSPGKYTYKFIVDGKWILDPANSLWEENQYGTGNSVLWVEQ